MSAATADGDALALVRLADRELRDDLAAVPLLPFVRAVVLDALADLERRSRGVALDAAFAARRAVVTRIARAVCAWEPPGPSRDAALLVLADHAAAADRWPEWAPTSPWEMRP